MMIVRAGTREAREPEPVARSHAPQPAVRPLARVLRGGPLPVAEVLGLQQAIGNRAVMRLLAGRAEGRPPGPAVQRYHAVGSTLFSGYTKGTGAQEPEFEFQRLDVQKRYDAARSVETYEMHAESHQENTPTLRVADANDLAVPQASKSEAKVFYATEAQVEQSNTELHDAGAPLRLRQGGRRLTVPRNGTAPETRLYEVTPDLGQVDLNNHECGAFVSEVVGASFDEAVIDPGGGPQAVPGMKEANRATRDVTINTALGGQNASQVGGNETAAPRVGEAYGIFARNTVPPGPQPGLLGSMAGALSQVATRLLSTTPYLQWGEHWAGVVARSGGDAVTLENYNRRVGDVSALEEAVERDHKELRGIQSAFKIGAYEQATEGYATQGQESALARMRRLGRNYQRYAIEVDRNVHGLYEDALGRWYFQMYGSGAQSFHESWKASLPGGVTFTVRGSDQDLQGQLTGKLRGLVQPPYRGATGGTLNAEVARIGQAAGRDAIIAAYVAGERRLCEAWLDAALNRKLGHLNGAKHKSRRARLRRWHGKAVQKVTAASGDEVVRACRAGVGRLENG